MKRKLMNVLSNVLFRLGKLFDVASARPEHFLIGGPRLSKWQYFRCNVAARFYDWSSTTYYEYVMTQQMRDELEVRILARLKEAMFSK